jgi:phosphatidylglycerol:prolipoprotein diacylglycerol transferase
MLPILYQSHDLVIYSYPLLMGIAWGVGYQVYFSSPVVEASPKSSQFLFWGLFFTSWIGAKLLFYLTSSHDSSLLTQVSFWTGGGLVFYGGLIASFLFLMLFKIVDKSLSWEKLNPLIPSLAIAHSIGRLGCFLAGCCYGRPTEHFWGIFMHGHHRHPTQLIEAVGLMVLGILLLKSKNKKGSTPFVTYIMSYSILRIIVELLRGDEVRGEWLGLSPSIWISLGLFSLGVSLIFVNKSRALRSP